MSLTSLDAGPFRLMRCLYIFTRGGESSLVTKEATPFVNTTIDSTEFELNFLSEFLLHDEFVPDPHSPPPDGDDLVTPSVSLLQTESGNGAEDDFKLEMIEFDASTVQQALDENLLNVNQTEVASPTASSSGSDYAAYPNDQDSAFTEENGEPMDRKAKRRAQVAISARRHRCRKKHEMMDLRKEVGYLDSQLDFLRSKHKMMRPHGAVAEWEEKAMAQRHKRKQSEEKNEELRRAIFLQGGFINNLKSMFAATGTFSAELNMRHYLHTYTRLGKNPRSRFRDYEAICNDTKLDMAIDVILRETTTPYGSNKPSITTRNVVPTNQEFGATTVGAYAFDTLDLRQIFVSVCAAIRDSGREWPRYSPVDAQVKVVDAPKENIRYGVSSIRYRSDDDEEEEVVVESRAISYYRVTDTYGILLWDYVDVDDLYPMEAETTMKRDVIGAVLVRREVCGDGVERVVCRSLCTKLHSFSLASASPDIARFSQSSTQGAEVCGSQVYNQVNDDFSRGLEAM
ncbi:hypothetical protein FI667_g7927, partial [Globisporangium splendens]